MDLRVRLRDKTVLLPLLLMAVGAVIAIAAGARLQSQNAAIAAERFEALASRVAAQLATRIRTYEYGLRGAAGAVIGAGVEAITRERFIQYSQSRDLAREFPGARGYGLIRRVAPEEVERFVQAARQDGKPEFRIVELAPHRGDRFVIQYIEPEAMNREAVGLDIASNLDRRLAAMVAVRTGRATLTAPITLVQATGRPQRGFLILLPVFRGGARPATPEERWQALFGWVYAPLVIDEVLADFDFRGGEFALAIDDVAYADAPFRFYGSDDGERRAAEGLIKRMPLELYGREWLVEVRALPSFVQQLNLAAPFSRAGAIVAVFLLLASLLRGYLLRIQRRIAATAEEARVAALAEQNARIQRNEEAVRSSERFLAAVADNVPSMIAYWDDGLRCRFANRALLDFLGRPLAEVLGASSRELLGDELHRANEPCVAAVLSGGVQQFERTIPAVDGARPRHTWWQYVPDRDGDRIRGFYAVVSDISELKESQIRLQELNLALQRQSQLADAANRSKSEFLANMSHEIRTPMNAVLGLTYLLEKSDLTPPVREMARKIDSAGRLLLGVLNDILDFSKIEAGRLDIERQPFRLADIFDDLANIMAYAAESKALEVIVGPVPAESDRLLGDALRLRQVLMNLAGNGIKFTESGHVAVRVSVAAGDATSIRLRFSVQDTGIGIDAAQQQEIFAPFSQADSSISRRFGGTGLGLAISRRLVELMGGRLEVRSTPGQGSDFFFELPFELAGETAPASRTADEAPAGAPHAAASHRLVGMRVLVVDDSEINREVAQRILEGEGVQVVLATDGRDALAMLEREAKGFDVVLMDVQMPVMDGYEATRRIRANPAWRALPVIALTAGAYRSQHEAALQAGMDGYIAKPFAPDELVALLARQAGRRRGYGVQHSPAQGDAAGASDSAALIDVEGALRNWREAGAYAVYLKRFADTHGEDGERLARLLAGGEGEAALALAHKLRGAAAALALQRVMRTAGAIEEALHAGRDVAAAVAALQEQLSDTLAAIAEWLKKGDGEDPVLGRRAGADDDVRRRMQALFDALDHDNPAAAEPFLQDLAVTLDSPDYECLRRHLDECDFPAARTLVATMLSRYDA